MGGYIDEGNFIQDWYKRWKEEICKQSINKMVYYHLKRRFIVTNSNTNQ